MREDHDIVVLSSARSDDSFSSSALSLAKELSKKNRVFFIDHPFSIKDYFTQYSRGEAIKSRRQALLFGKNIYRKADGASSNFTVVTPRLTIPINWLSQGKVYDVLSGANDKILASTLRTLIKDFKVKKYIFINIFVPYYLRTIPEDIKPEVNIYYTVDNISQEPYIAKHGVRLEKEAILKADVAFATSKELTRLVSGYAGNIHFLPNAADTSLFKRAMEEKLATPKELKEVTQTVICYTGNIGTRINYPLLRGIAQAHKDKILLMVGPISTPDYKAAGLDQLPNVLFVGPKAIGELPAYLQKSDCTIIPFEYSLLTKSIYPLKINEYLAAGKPVISTAFSDDIVDFEDVAYIAYSDQEFIDKIDLALKEDSMERQQKRLEKAKQNSWAARVEKFWNINEEFLNKRNRLRERLP
ncbi:MAG: glycosyltransferase [Bacteroidota bacterium]|jgi:glycosyltransferase involved in cell wall biosynthesis|nr:glycosyltransferase [Bacteroidota bacterium]